jgi:hypothetical protein
MTKDVLTVVITLVKNSVQVSGAMFLQNVDTLKILYSLLKPNTLRLLNGQCKHAKLSLATKVVLAPKIKKLTQLANVETS